MGINGYSFIGNRDSSPRGGLFDLLAVEATCQDGRIGKLCGRVRMSVSRVLVGAERRPHHITQWKPPMKLLLHPYPNRTYEQIVHASSVVELVWVSLVKDVVV